MRWMRFRRPGDGQLAFGLVDGDTVEVHAGELLSGTAGPTGERLPLAGLELLPPCRPTQIVGLWNNFRTAAAKNGWAEPAEPLYFLKSPSSAAGHGQRIPAAPEAVGRVFYEGELGVVLGRRAHALASLDEARACILGYTCANDVTALELLQRDPAFPQWTRAKSLLGFGAFGPWIDTSFDPAGRGLRTLVNGRERQAYGFDDMFFPPAELVLRLSQDLVLEPGDLILCGTSLGALPMKPGTTVEVVVEGLGTLANTYG